MQPLASLVLQKPLGQVPHEGGKRLAASSLPARIIHAWIAEGLRDDADQPPLQAIEVLPGPRSLASPSRWQQLAVLARLADGNVRDVTRLTVFSSSNDGIATVTASGLVEFVHLRTKAVAAPKFLGGPTPILAADQDRRAVLADWLVSADNPFSNFIVGPAAGRPTACPRSRPVALILHRPAARPRGWCWCAWPTPPRAWSSP